MGNYYQIYDIYPYLKHPEKYNGTRPITARSGWEIKFITKYLDVNENIISWASESTVIKYIRPDDGKYHRYFMDFTFFAKTKSGKVKEFWIEVKPYAQTHPPKEPKRRTKNYFKAVKTYMINEAKWQTTKEIVKEKNLAGNDVEFLIITEKDCSFFL